MLHSDLRTPRASGKPEVNGLLVEAERQNERLTTVVAGHERINAHMPDENISRYYGFSAAAATAQFHKNYFCWCHRGFKK